MRRRKMRRRIAVWLDEEADLELRVRSRAHGVKQAAYIRDLIVGRRPGALPGSEVAAADVWWDTRSPKRRVSIHRNHSTPQSDAPADDQLVMFGEEVL